MLRLPSLSELVSLFVRQRTVAGATKVLSDTAHRLEEVAQHHANKADSKRMRAAHLRGKASDLGGQVTDHLSEQRRAEAVSSNLNALLK